MLGDDDDTAAQDASRYDNTGAATIPLLPQPDAAVTAETPPLFSKNAEAELLLLATNFLLYTAIRIVVILVCRVYFPEAF